MARHRSTHNDELRAVNPQLYPDPQAAPPTASTPLLHLLNQSSSADVSGQPQSQSRPQSSPPDDEDYAEAVKVDEKDVERARNIARETSKIVVDTSKHITTKLHNYHRSYVKAPEKAIKTREIQELRSVLDDINRCHDNPLTMTFMEYKHLIQDSNTGRRAFLSDPNLRYSYVVCDMRQAHWILRHSSPPVVLVIRDETPRHHVEIQSFLHYLLCKPEVEFHDFNRPYDPKKYTHNYTVRMSPGQFLDKVKSDTAPIYNVLNLRGYKQNSMPSCFERLINYDILQLSIENDQSGKPGELVVGDLSSAVDFMLYATKGTISLPHRDSCGTMTTLEMEAGQKLCMIWPYQDLENEDAWPRESVSPTDRPFAIALRPHDIIVLPAGTIHEVYGLSETLICGRRFWDAREMLQVVQAIDLEIDREDITNEDPFEECQVKLRSILALWKRGSSYWQFSHEPGHLVEFERLINKIWPPPQDDAEQDENADGLDDDQEAESDADEGGETPEEGEDDTEDGDGDNSEADVVDEDDEDDDYREATPRPRRPRHGPK